MSVGPRKFILAIVVRQFFDSVRCTMDMVMDVEKFAIIYTSRLAIHDQFCLPYRSPELPTSLAGSL